MFTQQGGVGTAQLLVTSSPGHWEGQVSPLGSSQQPLVCYHRLEAFPTAHIPALQARDTLAFAGSSRALGLHSEEDLPDVAVQAQLEAFEARLLGLLRGETCPPWSGTKGSVQDLGFATSQM